MNASTGEGKVQRYRWLVLAVSFLSFVAYAFPFQEAPPLIPLIIDEFKVSHAEAGLLMSLVLIPGIFLSLPSGLLLSRYGVRKVGLLSLIAVVLGSLITATASSFLIVLAGRLILGIGGTFAITATSVIIAQWFPRKDLGKAMGIFAVNMPLSVIVAFPTASILGLTYGWRFPFYVGLVIGVAAVVSFAVVIKEGPFAQQKARWTMGEALRNFEIWKVGLIWMFFQAAALSFITWSPTLLEAFQNVPKIQASFLATLIMWVSLFCVPVYGYLSDRAGKLKLFIIVGGPLMASAYLVLAFTPSPLLAASILLIGITSATIPPIVAILPPEVLGPRMAGVGFGVTGMCASIGGALAQPLIGFILDSTRSYVLCFLWMALFPAFAAIVAYTLRTR